MPLIFRVDVSRITHDKPDTQASLALAIVHAPGVHVAIHWWMVGLIHLRDIPGVNPAHLDFPGASHELTAIPLDPACYSKLVAVEPDSAEMLKRLRPLRDIDQKVQFTVSSDELALRVFDAVIGEIEIRTMHPDSDFRSHWRQVIQNLAATVTRGRL